RPVSIGRRDAPRQRAVQAGRDERRTGVAVGVLEESFSSALRTRMIDSGWEPTARTGADRRQYFGSDRLREWIQPDFWAVLAALPGQPTVLAEIDTNPADLEHNVAKYL